MEAMEKAFQNADVNGDGVISVKEYHRILKTNGVSDAEIAHLTNIVDKNKDGFITKEEFLRKSITRHSSTGIVSNDTDSKVNLAFKIFDENHDGYVTEKEMRNHSKITKSQTNAIFKMNDYDHDGKLNKKEFQKFMTRSKSKSNE